MSPLRAGNDGGGGGDDDVDDGDDDDMTRKRRMRGRRRKITGIHLQVAPHHCAISGLLTKYCKQSLSQTLNEWSYDKSLMKVLKLSCLEKLLQRLLLCQSWAGSTSF